ncbi:heterokaryon incompatibility protein-domain-containing protein [Armillaria nabsnona]|nr:heterokaryon incompatibility protein-domain-containing protein [Armillaria nabsnona]
MSILLPTLSGLQVASDAESPNLVNIPTSSPAVDPEVPPEIRKLVCETCWNTVFSVEWFQQAWVTQFGPNRPESAPFTYTTPAWRQIQRQRCRHLLKFQHRCEWCKLVCRLIKRNYRRPHKWMPKDKKHLARIYFERYGRVTYLYLWVERCSCKLPIHAAEDDPAAKFIPNRGVLFDVDSALAYDLIKKRVVECSRHEYCPPPQYARLPTRVLDCSDPSQPHLFVSNDVEDYYATLSYAWGEKQPNRLKKKNLDSYIEGIPLENIPKTIMDAIMVTHKLGFHYLWVDSFCILQDSEDDKAREIAQMRHIFHNSYVTIIAACADKVSDGFLHDRRPTVGNWIRNEGLLPFRCPDGSVGTLHLVDGGRPFFLLEPVDKRAWCLEERVLSPRRLIYATHTLLYECETIHDNVNSAPNFVPLCNAEDIPRLHSRIGTPATNPDNDPTPITTEEAWYNIVTLYSRRNLTKPRDKLIALSGVAGYFHQFWSHSRYLAGLWEHQLPGSLLWHIPHRGESRCRPGIYRAPSWSWAAIDGRIDSRECWFMAEDICTIIHCTVTPARSDNAFGEVVDGYLVLETIVEPAVWEVDEEWGGQLFNVTGAPAESLNWTELWDYDHSGVGHARSDAVEPVSEGIGNVYIAFVGRLSVQGLALGLVLVPVIDEITNTQRYDSPGYPVFRRVGRFEASPSFPVVTAWLNCRFKRIKII